MMKIKMSAAEQYGTHEEESYGRKEKANKIRNQNFIYSAPLETFLTAKNVKHTFVYFQKLHKDIILAGIMAI